jgi:timeless protein
MCLQKPRPKKKTISPAEKRELCRKKLIERSKSKSFKVRALVHHVPTDKDIDNLFKEFTVDFLLKGYSTLITTLRHQLTTEENPDIDKSHFLWLITYFLKFASQLEVQLEQIGPVLTVETVAFLTFEGVRFYEELELAVREHKDRPVDLRPHLRRIHLVVTALREFIQTLQTYANFSHFTETDKAELTRVQVAVCSMRDLRQLFLMLIRHYNPSIQTRQYLNDVICANHVMLVLIENTDIGSNVMTSHLSQFATVEVMRQYGQLLESFDSNSEFVNDCIFTIMHHVCGDLKTPETLFIPQVLETFSDIWEREDVQLCDEWEDLIEYVIQQFITTIRSRPHAYASLLGCINNYETVDENGFTKTQLDNLYTYYNQFEDTPDPIECIIEVYKRNQNQTKTRLQVIQALLSQGIISLAQYMSMMYLKSVLSTCKNEHEGSIVVEVGSEKCDSEGNDTELENNLDLKTQGTDQIETLKELLKTQGKECLLTWLQQTLLDACCVKINGKNMIKQDGKSLEPVLYHFNDINQSIPMVAWNKNQESGLQTETFMLLLHKLGFHLANDVGKCFPRIPHFWSADHLFQLALKMGPVQKEDLNVDSSLLEISLSSNEETKEMIHSPAAPTTNQSDLSPLAAMDPLVAMDTSPSTDLHPFTMPTPTTSWIQLALTSKKKSQMAASTQQQKSVPNPLSDKIENDSMSMEKMQISDDETA